MTNTEHIYLAIESNKISIQRCNIEIYQLEIQKARIEIAYINSDWEHPFKYVYNRKGERKSFTDKQQALDFIQTKIDNEYEYISECQCSIGECRGALREIDWIDNRD